MNSLIYNFQNMSSARHSLKEYQTNLLNPQIFQQKNDQRMKSLSSLSGLIAILDGIIIFSRVITIRMYQQYLTTLTNYLIENTCHFLI